MDGIHVPYIDVEICNSGPNVDVIASIIKIVSTDDKDVAKLSYSQAAMLLNEYNPGNEALRSNLIALKEQGVDFGITQNVHDVLQKMYEPNGRMEQFGNAVLIHPGQTKKYLDEVRNVPGFSGRTPDEDMANSLVNDDMLLENYLCRKRKRLEKFIIVPSDADIRIVGYDPDVNVMVDNIDIREGVGELSYPLAIAFLCERLPGHEKMVERLGALESRSVTIGVNDAVYHELIDTFGPGGDIDKFMQIVDPPSDDSLMRDLLIQMGIIHSGSFRSGLSAGDDALYNMYLRRMPLYSYLSEKTRQIEQFEIIPS